MTMDATQICDAIKAKPMSICKAIYTSFTGVSPLVASELAFRAGMDADQSLLACTDDESTISQTTLHGFLMKSATTNFIR